MYLIFDTETTGLPLSYKAPVSDIENWPRVVQVAWRSFDDKGKKTGSACYVIRPDGFTIPKEAEKVHGISTARAKREGVCIKKVLDEFTEELEIAKVLVAHNLEFDTNIVGAEFHRIGVRRPFRKHTLVCTMKESTDHCELPGRYGDYKWPKLSELHVKLFKKNVKEMHDAGADVETCAKCFFELKRIGVIRIK
jgi:DNA polymerase III epsilon subunit-like protein